MSTVQQFSSGMSAAACRRFPSSFLRIPFADGKRHLMPSSAGRPAFLVAGLSGLLGSRDTPARIKARGAEYEAT